jgi:hypothetical protein
MSVQFLFYLPNLVSPVFQLYYHVNLIHIHTCIHSFIHAYSTHTNIILYMVALSPSVLFQLYLTKVSSPALSKNEMSASFYLHKGVIPCFVRKRDVNKFLLSQKCRPLLCQITRCHPIFFLSKVSSPALSDNEMSPNLFLVRSVVSCFVR